MTARESTIAVSIFTRSEPLSSITTRKSKDPSSSTVAVRETVVHSWDRMYDWTKEANAIDSSGLPIKKWVEGRSGPIFSLKRDGA